MARVPILTYFDTAGRRSPQALAAEVAQIQAEPWIASVLDSLPSPTFLLNEHRQVVLANSCGRELAMTLGGDGLEGARLGEVFGCINVPAGPDGCGTSPACRHCGLGQTQQAFGQSPGRYTAELRVRAINHGAEVAHTFSATLAALPLNGTPLRVCTLIDITAARSREVQNQIFFHDVLNTAQAVQGAAGLLREEDDPASVEELARVVSQGSATLVGEIEAQRDVQRVEDGTVVIPLIAGSVWQVAAETVELYRHSRFCRGRNISITPNPGDDIVPIARVQLSRVIGNLIKNALEASAPTETIDVRVAPARDHIALAVQNAAVMPESVRAQVFQRFFSTKASSGRGLGTYSVRLLVTRVLRGTVEFTSAVGAGTTFTVRLPRH